MNYDDFIRRVTLIRDIRKKLRLVVKTTSHGLKLEHIPMRF